MMVRGQFLVRAICLGTLPRVDNEQLLSPRAVDISRTPPAATIDVTVLRAGRILELSGTMP